MALCWNITSIKRFNLSSDRVLDSQKVTCVHGATYFMIVTYVSICGTACTLLNTRWQAPQTQSISGGNHDTWGKEYSGLGASGKVTPERPRKGPGLSGQPGRAIYQLTRPVWPAQGTCWQNWYSTQLVMIIDETVWHLTTCPTIIHERREHGKT